MDSVPRSICVGALAEVTKPWVEGKRQSGCSEVNLNLSLCVLVLSGHGASALSVLGVPHC